MSVTLLVSWPKRRTIPTQSKSKAHFFTCGRIPTTAGFESATTDQEQQQQQITKWNDTYSSY
jgi:hypothetical protein